MSKKLMEFPMTVRRGSVAVKIYRVQCHGQTRFSVSHFAGGKRTQKMFTRFPEAYADAESKAESISRGELDVLELRSRDRIDYVQAVEALQPTGTPLAIAAKEYAAAWRALGGKTSLLEAAREFARRHLHELPDKTVPEAVQEMLADKARENASQAYQKVLKVHLGKLATAFQCQLSQLTSSQVADFLRSLDLKARSRNNLRANLGAFFKYSKERGWLPKDHDGISLVPKFKEAPTTIEILTPQELACFLTYTRPELVPFLAIGAFAGLRSIEIERLDWSEVHLAERFIEIKAAKAKTASRRLVPMSENLAQWLADHTQKAGRVVPFDNMSKQIRWLVEDTNRGLIEAATAAGKDPKKVKRLKWKKNALRHSFISYRVADIQNVNQVALEAGNSPGIIFKHYRELVRPAQARQWFGITPEPDAKVTVLPKAEAKAIVA